jgi:methyl-accepting chemotaxis protein
MFAKFASLIDNRSLGFKTALPPVLLGVLLVLGLLAAINVIGIIRDHGEEMATYRKSQLELAGDISTLLANARGDLYQVFTTLAQDSDARAAEKPIAMLRNDLVGLRKALTDLRAITHESDLAALQDKALKELEGYNKKAMDLVDVASIDVSTALLVLSDLENSQDAMIAAIRNIRESLSLSIKTALAADAAAADSARLVFALGGLAALVLGALLTVAVGRSAVRGLGRICVSTKALSEGDLAADIDGIERRDEVGVLARALVSFRDNARESVRMQGERESEQRQRHERQASLEQYIERFDAAVAAAMSEMGGSMSAMQNQIISINKATEASQGLTSGVAQSSEQMSSNVQAVAAATEEMSRSLDEIGTRMLNTATAVSSVAQRASDAESHGGALAAAAEKAEGVIEAIANIARQTNLLALNATIEAARAGEAGKGFAVVASEVKGLAKQTAAATEEVSVQIRAIQNGTREVVGTFGAVLKALREVDALSASVAAAVEQQSSATSEIVRNVQQAAAGTQQVSSSIGEVRLQAQEARQAADNARQAVDLSLGVADRLRGEVEQFLNKVKVA